MFKLKNINNYMDKHGSEIVKLIIMYSNLFMIFIRSYFTVKFNKNTKKNIFCKEFVFLLTIISLYYKFN